MMTGDMTWSMMCEKNLPKKYEVGVYILFASSLFITGACKGTYRTTLIEAEKLRMIKIHEDSREPGEEKTNENTCGSR